MAIAIIAEALGAGFSTGRHFQHAGFFVLGLGILLYARRSLWAWPLMLVCPALLLTSEVTEWRAGEESIGGCCFACSILLLWAVGLCVGWAQERRHARGA
jgi:hypothetical protein